MGHPPICTPKVVNMNAQVCRDPKSSNRIEISRFVKFLMTFDWFQGSTPLGGWGLVNGGGTQSGCLGGCPMHMHMCMHMHACAYMYKHDNFMQMAAPIGKSWGISLWHHRSCVCMCVHMCTSIGHPQTPWQSPTHIHPPPPPGGWTPKISQKSIKI